jgi:hypothetical protein
VLAVILQAGIVSAGLVAAFEIAFWWAVGFSALAVILSIILPGRPRPVELPLEGKLDEVTV